MPVSMDWDNVERTVIRVTFMGVWGTDDLYRMINKGVVMLKSVDHPVDSIFDFTTSTFSPRNVLPAAEKMETALQHNNRLDIVVKANVYIRSILKVAKIFAPNALANLYFVDTVEQAYELIRKQSVPVLDELVQ